MIKKKKLLSSRSKCLWEVFQMRHCDSSPLINDIKVIQLSTETVFVSQDDPRSNPHNSLFITPSTARFPSVALKFISAVIARLCWAKPRGHQSLLYKYARWTRRQLSWIEIVMSLRNYLSMTYDQSLGYGEMLIAIVFNQSIFRNNESGCRVKYQRSPGSVSQIRFCHRGY